LCPLFQPCRLSNNFRIIPNDKQQKINRQIVEPGNGNWKGREKGIENDDELIE